MKRLLLLVLVIALTTGITSAQSPEMFNYQSVARDDQGNVLSNQNVGIKISILQGSASGTVVYEEEHSKTTNAQGLVNLKIGDGSAISGTFSNIDWSSGPYFIKVGLDDSGGSSYSTMGTSQLVSVPYAKYAESSGNSFSGDYENLSNKPWKRKGDTLYRENKKIAIGTDSLTHPVTIEGSGAGITMMVRDDYPFMSLSAMNNTNAGYNLNLENEVKGGFWYNSANDNVILQRSDNIGNDITITPSRNIGINTSSPQEQLDINGAVRVQDTTENPKPGRIYGNSMPLAYGEAQSVGGLSTTPSYGIDSVKHISTGEYRAYLQNQFEEFAIVSVSPFDANKPLFATYLTQQDSNVVNVYIWDVNGNKVDSYFSIVVHGQAQEQSIKSNNEKTPQENKNIMGVGGSQD